MPPLFFKSGKTFLSSPSSYKLLWPFKESSSKQVFKALHQDPETGLSRAVVLKIFLEESSFREEFESLSQVSSPHCVRLLAMENFSGRKALVLEYIRGVSLFQLREGFLLSQEEIAYILNSINQGLLDLKAKGLSHGDLSLDNVLVDEKARVYLIDFGKANYKGETQGTPPFIAPEVFKNVGVSFLSDLYSLGVIEQRLSASSEPSSFSLNKGSLKREERLQYLEDKSSPLLSLDPKKRHLPPHHNTMAKAFLKEGGQVRLACKVKDLLSVLNERRISTVKTKSLVERAEGKTTKARSPFVVAKPPLLVSHPFYCFLKGFFLRPLQLMGLSLLFASGVASYQASPLTHKVKLYTRQWFSIQLGSAQFYSPAVFFLKSGSYSIDWKNKTDSGKLHLSLRSKSSVVLNDSAFLQKKTRLKKRFLLTNVSL